MQYMSVTKLSSVDGLPKKFFLEHDLTRIFKESNVHEDFDPAQYNSTIVFNFLNAFRKGKIHFLDATKFKKVFTVKAPDSTSFYICFLCDSLESAQLVHTLETTQEIQEYIEARENYINMCGLTVSGRKIIQVVNDGDAPVTFESVGEAYDSINNN